MGRGSGKFNQARKSGLGFLTRKMPRDPGSLTRRKPKGQETRSHQTETESSKELNVKRGIYVTPKNTTKQHSSTAIQFNATDPNKCMQLLQLSCRGSI